MRVCLYERINLCDCVYVYIVYITYRLILTVSQPILGYFMARCLGIAYIVRL